MINALHIPATAALLASLAAPLHAQTALMIKGEGSKLFFDDRGTVEEVDLQIFGDNAQIEAVNYGAKTVLRVELYGDGVPLRVISTGGSFEGVAMPCRPGAVPRDIVTTPDGPAYAVIGCN